MRPCLAEAWTLSADARTWTFRLRDTVRFHDGEALAAKDVVGSLQRIRAGDIGGELGTSGVMQSYLAGSTIRAEGPKRVALTTVEPTADLLDLLVDIPIVSATGVAQLPDRLLGTGPYRLLACSDSEAHLAKSDHYWGDTHGPEEIVFVESPDPAARLEGLLSGSADVAAALPPSAPVEASGAEILHVRTSVCAAFMCNLLSGPCMDRSVRQALNYAINVPDLIHHVAHGAALPLSGPLTSLHLGFDSKVQGYHYAPDRARALLDAAGRPSLRITLDVPRRLPDDAPELARRMALYYSDVGIETEVVEYADRPAYAHRVRAKRIHDAACFDSSPLSTFRVLLEKFHSDLRGPWWLGYDNPRVNTLIDTARACVYAPQRRLAYQQAYALLSADAPWIFLYNPIQYVGVRRAVRAWLPLAEHLMAFL